jgi:hypothetical protein
MEIFNMKPLTTRAGERSWSTWWPAGVQRRRFGRLLSATDFTTVFATFEEMMPEVAVPTSRASDVGSIPIARSSYLGSL